MDALQQGSSALRTPHSALEERLTRRWVDFGRLLRRNGVETTAGQVRDLLRALPLLDLGARDAVYFAARVLLCARKEDLPRFDLVFRQFWGRTRQIIIPSDTGSLQELQAPEPRVQNQQLSPVTPDRSEIFVDRTSLVGSDDDGAGPRD